MKVLTINNLTKRYGKLTAVNNLNLSVEEGQIMGILGPNGSGKTTTLGIILGITQADAGSYEWFGGRYGTGSAVLRHVGALLETPNFYPYMTAEQNLQIVAHIKRAKNVDYDYLLRLVNLAHRKDTPFRAYSLGMKQRLAIAATMVGDPAVLIFDEPTNGLDPVGIAEIRQTLQTIAAEGKTIFMASHILDEVEKVCSHVAIIKNGNLLAEGAVGSILGNQTTVEMAAENLALLRGVLAEHPKVAKIEQKHNLLIVNTEDDFSVADLSRLATEKGVVLTHLVERKRSLEEEFLQITK
jgi:ABC-2 type transport system ATP-binding protein